MTPFCCACSLWTWGDKYDGEWCNGKKEGACIHTYADGGRFDGEMLNDVREGYGASPLLLPCPLAKIPAP
eukprot:5771256-Prymnesium_polylepis.2